MTRKETGWIPTYKCAAGSYYNVTKIALAKSGKLVYVCMEARGCERVVHLWDALSSLGPLKFAVLSGVGATYYYHYIDSIPLAAASNNFLLSCG